MLTDRDLTALLYAGEETAFTEIYNRYWKQLFYTANNILQDQEGARDAVQDVFVSLWQRKNDVEIDSLKAYLRQAIRFRVLKAIREQRSDERLSERLKKVTAGIISDNPLLFKEQQHLLKELVNKLPEDCREAFRLSREENLTYKQIALQLNISEKTVEKRLSKSLKHIRGGLNVELCILIVMVLAQ